MNPSHVVLSRTLALTGKHDLDVTREDLARQVFAALPQGIDQNRVHVYGANICNGALDHYFTRFTPEALQEVAELVPGTPLMRGHVMSGPELGRFFWADRAVSSLPKSAPRQDRTWVRGMFYFPRDAEGNALAERIDLGVSQQVSLHWACAEVACSVCGNDMRSYECGHIPGEVYEQGGLAEGRFAGVTHVLETSLVAQGGQKGTSLFNPQAQARSFPVAAVGSFMRAVDYFQAKAGELGSPEPQFARADGMRTSIQSLLCSKSRFETAGDAAIWAREHQFRADKVDTTAKFYRFRQLDPARCQSGTERTITLTSGVEAVVCKLQESRGCRTGRISLFPSKGGDS